jgi:hypothetical protein
MEGLRSIFRKMPAPSEGGGGNRFSVRKYENAKMTERSLFLVDAKRSTGEM